MAILISTTDYHCRLSLYEAIVISQWRKPLKFIKFIRSAHLQHTMATHTSPNVPRMYLKQFFNDERCIGKKGICPNALVVLAGGLLNLSKPPGHTSNLTVVIL